MASWYFEPGHTEVEFRARHMMVTWVRGLYKNVSGTMTFDPDDPVSMSFETSIDASSLWTGVQQRDDHLRSADFLDVAHYPTITFKSTSVRQVGAQDFIVDGDLTLRGVTQNVPLKVRYLGQWATPWWEDGIDKGPKMRAGFSARLQINRYDYGVSWNDKCGDDGVVVSPTLELRIDAEAIRKD